MKPGVAWHVSRVACDDVSGEWHAHGVNERHRRVWPFDMVLRWDDGYWTARIQAARGTDALTREGANFTEWRYPGLYEAEEATARHLARILLAALAGLSGLDPGRL